MELTRRQTWWLTFALFALQGATSLTWGTLGLPKDWIAGFSTGISYLQTLLMFALHGTIPGTIAGQSAVRVQAVSDAQQTLKDAPAAAALLKSLPVIPAPPKP